MWQKTYLTIVLLVALTGSSFARILQDEQVNWEGLRGRLNAHNLVVKDEEYQSLQEEFPLLRQSDSFKGSVPEIAFLACCLRYHSLFQIYSEIVDDYRTNGNLAEKSKLYEILEAQWGDEAQGVEADVYRFGDAVKESQNWVTLNRPDVNVGGLYFLYRDYFDVAFMGKTRDSHPIVADCFKPFESLLDEMLASTRDIATQAQAKTSDAISQVRESDFEDQVKSKVQERQKVVHHGWNKKIEAEVRRVRDNVKKSDNTQELKEVGQNIGREVKRGLGKLGIRI